MFSGKIVPLVDPFFRRSLKCPARSIPLKKLQRPSTVAGIWPSNIVLKLAVTRHARNICVFRLRPINTKCCGSKPPLTRGYWRKAWDHCLTAALPNTSLKVKTFLLQESAVWLQCKHCASLFSLAAAGNFQVNNQNDSEWLITINDPHCHCSHSVQALLNLYRLLVWMASAFPRRSAK